MPLQAVCSLNPARVPMVLEVLKAALLVLPLLYCEIEASEITTVSLTLLLLKGGKVQFFT